MAARPKQVSDAYFHKAGKLKAPAALPEPAAALWNRIMRTTPEDQWREADVPLLAMFCRVGLLADDAVAHLEQDGQVDAAGKVSPWVKVASDHSKTLAALASKLRLAPASRIRAEAHSLQQVPAHGFPWELSGRRRKSSDDDDLLARPS